MADIIDRCVRIGGTTVHLYPNREDWAQFTDLVHRQYGHGAIAKTLWTLAKEYMTKFESNNGHKLDIFFGSEYIAKPNIDDDIENKILPWLRVQQKEDIDKIRINAYRTYVYAQALLDTSPDQRRTIGLDFETLWKRYR